MSKCQRLSLGCPNLYYQASLRSRLGHLWEVRRHLRKNTRLSSRWALASMAPFTKSRRRLSDSLFNQCCLPLTQHSRNSSQPRSCCRRTRPRSRKPSWLACLNTLVKGTNSCSKKITLSASGDSKSVRIRVSSENDQSCSSCPNTSTSFN